MRTFQILVASAVAAAVVLTAGQATAQEKRSQASIVAGEVAAISGQLSLRPKIANDYSEKIGEYCFFTGWDAHHTHYAIDPAGTQEDVIDFVDPRPLIEAGFDVDKLPRQPARLGKMKPNQWYYLAAGQLDPHHDDKYELPLLMRATELN